MKKLILFLLFSVSSAYPQAQNFPGGGGVSSNSPKNIIDVTAAPYNIAFDAKWATGINVTFSTAQTNCNGNTVPAGTCITTTAQIPAFVSSDVGKYASGNSGCQINNPPACPTRFLGSATIVAVFDTHHAQVSLAVTANSDANGANFYWGTTGQVVALRTAMTAIADAGTAGVTVQFPCPTSQFSGGMILDGDFNVPTHSGPVGISGCPGGGSILIVTFDLAHYTGSSAAYIFVGGFLIGQAIQQYGTGDTYENLFFWGAGGANVGGFAANSSNAIVFNGGPTLVRNVSFVGWGSTVTVAFPIYGITASAAGATIVLQNVNSFAGGNFPCRTTGAGTVASISWTGALCGGSLGSGMNIQGGQVALSGAYAWGQSNLATSNAYGVVVTTPGTASITGSFSNAVFVNSGGVTLSNDNIGGPFALTTGFALSVGGGNVTLSNNIWSGLAAQPWLSQSGGIIIDLGNETGNTADANVPSVSGGFYSQIPIIICSNTTPVTVNANVATDQLLMACTIPAGTLNFPGRVLEVWLADVYTTPAASVATINTKVKLCTVSGCGSGTVINLTNITSSANPGTVTNNSINVVNRSTTQTTGASAAFETHGNMIIDLGATPGVADTTFSDSTTATVGTIDAALQLFLQVTGAFSVANASNSRTERQLIVRTLN